MGGTGGGPPSSATPRIYGTAPPTCARRVADLVAVRFAAMLPVTVALHRSGGGVHRWPSGRGGTPMWLVVAAGVVAATVIARLVAVQPQTR